MDEKNLYTFAELNKGYVESDAATYVATEDFKAFQGFVASGQQAPSTYDALKAQALHDASISNALRLYLKGVLDKSGSFVGIMGGHGVNRGAPAYNLTADVARRLTQDGYIVVTGGGPGAMEAAHFGACFANSDDADYEKAKGILAASGAMPSPGAFYNPTTGQIDPGIDLKKVLDPLCKWLNVAIDVRKGVKAPGESLAIPTWVYGTEPTTPFATHYAKYFEDSVREQSIIKDVQAGIIFAQGGGGTLRELFQLIETNYYVAEAKDFIPMIFLDPSDYWRRHPALQVNGDRIAPYVDVQGILKDSFDAGIGPASVRGECWKKVLFSTQYDDITKVLGLHKGKANENLNILIRDGAHALRRSISTRI